MKVIAINGSTRPNGNTRKALELLKEELGKAGNDVEIINLAQKKLNPCHACYKCKGSKTCVQNDDINDIFKQLEPADAIILGSPTYFSNISSRMAMFIERTGIMSRANGNLFAGKIGASVAVARRAGHNVVYSILNYYFGISQMPIATSSYWNVLLGGEPGAIDKDSEGLETMKTLAKNLDNMLKKLR
jgi:multimeric flavodoxin WrbA